MQYKCFTVDFQDIAITSCNITLQKKYLQKHEIEEVLVNYIHDEKANLYCFTSIESVMINSANVRKLQQYMLRV